MAKRILLVEGSDDLHVFLNLCMVHSLPENFEIMPHGGYTQLLEAFPNRLKESDMVSVGVVIDADLHFTHRWDAVRHHLQRAGYSGIPSSPPETGLILEAPPNTILPKTGVWIMPNNSDAGILESFLKFLVPSGDQLLAYAESCVGGIPPELRKFDTKDEPKALIHTWLAWQEEPGKPFGQSLQNGALQADAEAAMKVVGWLRNLFSS